MAKSQSNLSRAFSEDGAHKTHIGGQALLEGVMMRGTYNWAAAVREPDGNIHEEQHEITVGRKKNSWLNWPVVRGCRALVESLILGYKALEVAALYAYDDEEEEEEQAKAKGGKQVETATESLLESDWEPDQEDFPLEFDDPHIQHSGMNEPSSFSWFDDFGNPDTMIDALGAQRTLEVVAEPAPIVQPDSDKEQASSQSDFDCKQSSINSDSGFEQDSGKSDSSLESDSSKKPSKKSSSKESSSEDTGGFGKAEMAIALVFGVVLALALFVIAPAVVTNLIVGEYDSHTILWNIVDGLLRVAVFVFYLWLIGRMKDIKRMFGYHGAEHKTIHCYEHGLPLTPENARTFPRLHVRCGTAFLIMVLIIAIVVYSVVPVNALISAWGVPDGAPKLILVICVRIVFAPVIAGISYEITVKWAGNHPNNPVVKVILWPGMQMQYLTTNEPDDSMLECAIVAMQRVLEREEAEEKTDLTTEEISTSGKEHMTAATAAN